MNFEERIRAQAHLLYEIAGISRGRRLLDAIDCSTDAFVAKYEGDLRNALLESTLVHVRNVIEFLIGRPPWKGKAERRQRNRSDLLPTAFAPQWLLPTGRHHLDKWLDLIDKHLSHLTLARLTLQDDSPEWHDAMLHETAAVLEAYAAAVGQSDTGFGHTLGLHVDELNAASGRRAHHVSAVTSPSWSTSDSKGPEPIPAPPALP